MKRAETSHYIFYYNENSKAERDINEIAAYQEECFEHICSTLKVEPQFKLEYYLCDSPEEVGGFCGDICGDYEPCNGFADTPNRIYAVYNEEIQCIGFHEDAHLISYIINRPECVAIREGLAMYFDQTWWGTTNLEWTKEFLKKGKYVSVVQLLDDDTFYSKDCAITYPIMGAFTEWLIKTYGVDKYIQFYKNDDVKYGIVKEYGMKIEELEKAFIGGMQMKNKIRALISAFVREYESKEEIMTKWGEPLVGFADAKRPEIANFKSLIGGNHGTPEEVLDDASIVIAYYVPFTKEIAKTNANGSKLASREWAIAYEETNAMFKELNAHVIAKLEEWGYKAGISPKTNTFSTTELKSDWSYRHYAYLAGLGTFGINNMLITKHGCCGRYNNIVTNLDVVPDEPIKEEYCLYKKNGTCAVCVKNCPVGALKEDAYDRHLCYSHLLENAKVHTGLGSSYTNEDGEGSNSVGSDVCGKCVTQSPCAFWKI